MTCVVRREDRVCLAARPAVLEVALFWHLNLFLGRRRETGKAHHDVSSAGGHAVAAAGALRLAAWTSAVDDRVAARLREQHGQSA